MSLGVVWMDVPFVGPKVLYIASSVDASFVVPLKAPCVMSSVCSLASCMDGGQFSIMQPDVLTCVPLCSLTTCTVIGLVQFNVMCQDVKRDLTCDEKFLIPVIADHNTMPFPDCCFHTASIGMVIVGVASLDCEGLKCVGVVM